MIETLQEWLSNPLFHRWDGGVWQGTVVTLYMTAVTMLLTVLLGLPLGVALYETDGSRSPVVRVLNQVVGFVVNVLRSFPFFILIIALIPVTSALTGRSTGPNAAMLALTIAAVPFAARLFELNLREIPAGKIEAVRMMGATRWQVIRQVLIPEALPGIIGSITTTTIAVIGYTAMAGSVNSGGLGQLAYNRGYTGYQTEIIVATVILLVAIVILVQLIGSRLARAVDHRARTA
ncbi:methionine ABC transporter permease [Brachybacterium aquaticum]|uniref:D-methionine transport system permease protein n=1 Tax=Brachybacterium aquaticum TaxID=1432564 RepID=A0A841AHW7_9MICO|nr:methionine ABC transporter permease [Brachybacterium aquaticum]MBB5832654.1 D-methionine transport system permease protein [Brachybacterium aquaticum]